MITTEHSSRQVPAIPNFVVMVGTKGKRQSFPFLSDLGPDEGWQWVLEVAHGDFYPVRVGNDLIILPMPAVWGHA